VTRPHRASGRPSTSRRLLRRYSGKNAAAYEQRRRGAKWRREDAAFLELYEQINPATVLDCPVGTGRWLPLYAERGAAVLGVDLSPDMLEMARRRTPPGADTRLQVGDVLRPDTFARLGRFDLAVCVRLVHWLRPDDLSPLAETFSATAAQYLILDASVSRRVAPKPGWTRGWVKRCARAAFGPPAINHVHDEGVLMRVLADRGWRELDRRTIANKPDRRYALLLLKRESAKAQGGRQSTHIQPARGRACATF
jgi:SAM-dependent methyltransferase